MTGYLYILKHGIGPGTMPKDVTILKEKDLPNYYTAVWLDRFLTTSELKQYDIPPETEINKYLNWIDYCQADNGDDVVPCKDIKASIMPKPTVDSVLNLIDDNKIVFKNDVAYWNRGKGVIPKEYRDCIAQTEYAHWINEWSCEQAEKYGSRAYYDYDGETDVDACDKVMAASNTTTKFSNELVQKIRDEGFGYIIDNSKNSLDNSIVNALLYSAAYSKNPDYLAYLYEQDEYDSIRLAQTLGRNPNTPEQVLDAIWSKYSDTYELVAWEVVRNPNVPEYILEEALNSPFRSIRSNAEDRLGGNIDACDNITASKIIASKMSDIDLLANEALDCTTKDELGGVISGLDSLGLRKLYLHYMEMLRDDSLSVGYIASDLSDTLYNMFSGEVDACDRINASTKPKYFANMVSASEFDPFDDEYGIHRVSKSDLNYIRDSIYERISDITNIKFSIDMTITKQLPDAIAKVHITLRNLDDGTILEYDDRVDSNNLEGTIQRLTKFAKALITENWSEYPDNLTAEDVERICEDIYDEIETTIFDYYLYGTPELMVLYDEEDPTFLYNIDTDYSDLADSLTFNIKLEALDRDDLEGLVENYLKPITSAYNTEYTIEHSNTGRTGKTGYIHIKFQ